MPAPALPILYSFRRCPYAMRARMALVASGQHCELREVVLRDKPAELLHISPKGTVPVLQLPDGQVLEQSLDIMLWALARHDPAHWLEPAVGTLDTMLALVAECDGDFKHHLDRTKYPQRYGGADAGPHRAQAALFIARLEAQLSDQHGLGGAHTTLADVAIAPFVRQFAMVDTAWFAAQPWPRVQAWLEALFSSVFWRQAMEKYPPWVAGTPPCLFPCAFRST